MKTSNILKSLALLVTLGFATSCEMEENQPIVEVKETTNELLGEIEEGISLDQYPENLENLRLGPWNMIHEETFETTPFTAYVHTQFPLAHSFQVVNTPALRGNRAGRFELRKGDPMVTSVGVRSEVLFEQVTHENRWYSFGLYLPASGFAKDRNGDVLAQWHQNIGSPASSFRVINDRFFLRMMKSDGTIELNDMGPATKDQWNEFVFHFIHSSGSNGLIEIWHNGKKVITRNGANMHVGKLPAWKVGIYKAAWENSTTDTNLRIAFFDNIRIGNEKSSFEEMAPSTDNLAGWGPLVQDTRFFSLINANTHTNLGRIRNYAIVSISELKTNRISIQAEVVNEFQGSIRFVLTGPKNMTFFDNQAPYAMFGDDGNGKYYNAGGLPAGNYTMVATPFDERNGRGKEGTSRTIRFQVVN
jgi:hypothetical protein